MTGRNRVCYAQRCPSFILIAASPLCDRFDEPGKVCKSLKNQKMISMRLRMLIPENKPTRPPWRGKKHATRWQLIMSKLNRSSLTKAGKATGKRDPGFLSGKNNVLTAYLNFHGCSPLQFFQAFPFPTWGVSLRKPMTAVNWVSWERLRMNIACFINEILKMLTSSIKEERFVIGEWDSIQPLVK